MATHYVASDGIATWANSTNISTPCSITTANTNADAGDIVYLRGGTYNVSGSAINPSNTGTSGNIISFSGYQDETVNFNGTSGSSVALDLDSEYGTVRSYIKITKMNFSDFNKHLWIRRGAHNEISHCTVLDFYNTAGIAWIASVIYRNASYNWVHDCTFGKYGYFDPNDNSVLFEIGNDDVAAGEDTHHNLVEDNTFYHGGHHVCSVDGRNNIFRNNYVRNEAWSSYLGTDYGNRILFTVGTSDDDVYRNLIEGNRIAFGGECADEELGGSGGTFASSYNIIRRNVFDHCLLYAMYFTHYGGSTSCKGNHVYNNTYWYNGYSTTGPLKGAWHDSYSHPIFINEDATYTRDNIFKNNIFYDNKCTLGAQYSLIGFQSYNPLYTTSENNWLDNAGDPKLTDLLGIPDETDKDQFDFTLQSDSGCINNGGFLTTITSANGSGTSFVVDDAGYFMDGWGMSALGVAGDVIKLEGQATTRTITDVNYDTNTLTIDGLLTWTQGQGVALAYNGAAPDQGAHEHAAGVALMMILTP